LGLFALAEDGSGDVFVTFTRPNPVPISPVDQGNINIARLNADGTVDSAFSTANGFPTESGARGNPQSIGALLPTPAGKLYVGGSLYSFNGRTVSSLIRLNQDGTLDSAFNPNIGYLIGVTQVVDLEPAADGTSDLYAGLWVGPVTRVHETGAFDSSFQADQNLRGITIAVAQDGSGDVLLSAASPATSSVSLFRFSRNGALVSAPTFVSPTLVTSVSGFGPSISTIVPLQDGTGDFYIGGYFTSYNGAVVNHFARIHADGSLASVVN
jgi:hypothetical protein